MLLDHVQTPMLMQKEYFPFYHMCSHVKTKKRNKLSMVNVNVLCVLKSAIKSRKESITEMKINEEHLSLMSSKNLYATCPEKKSTLKLYAGDSENVAGTSST